MRKRSGVSLLLESVVGLGLFATALLFALGIIVGVANTSAESREYSLARQTALQVMEQQRGLPYSSISIPPPGSYLISVPFTNDGVDSALDLTVTLNITEPVVNERKDILVNVSWVHGSLVRTVLLESSAINI